MVSALKERNPSIACSGSDRAAPMRADIGECAKVAIAIAYDDDGLTSDFRRHKITRLFELRQSADQLPGLPKYMDLLGLEYLLACVPFGRECVSFLQRLDCQLASIDVLQVHQDIRLFVREAPRNLGAF